MKTLDRELSVLVAASAGVAPRDVERVLLDAGMRSRARRPTLRDAAAAADVDFVLVGDSEPRSAWPLATAVSRMQRMLPDSSVVAIVATPEEVNVRALLAAGADAVVPHATLERTLGTALAGVSRGQLSLPLGMWRARAPALLPKRQRETLCMAIAGLTNAEIAERLLVAPGTVGTHLQFAFRHLLVHSRGEAANLLLGIGPEGSPARAPAARRPRIAGVGPHLLPSVPGERR